MNSFKHLSNLSSVMAQDLLLLVHGKLCLSTRSFGVLQLTQQLIQKKRKRIGEGESVGIGNAIQPVSASVSTLVFRAPAAQWNLLRPLFSFVSPKRWLHLSSNYCCWADAIIILFYTHRKKYFVRRGYYRRLRTVVKRHERKTIENLVVFSHPTGEPEVE